MWTTVLPPASSLLMVGSSHTRDMLTHQQHHVCISEKTLALATSSQDTGLLPLHILRAHSSRLSSKWNRCSPPCHRPCVQPASQHQVRSARPGLQPPPLLNLLPQPKQPSQ